jgi:glycerol uptake facilitator protein
MSEFIAEFIGTFILILLGNGVVANVSLKDTFGNSGGWIVITAGWGLGVFVAVFMVGDYSGAHINPAVSIGLASAGLFAWSKVPIFILAQMLGAMTGALTVYLFYKDHYDKTEDGATKRASFCTSPAIRNKGRNFFSESIGTFVLILGVLLISVPTVEGENMETVKVGLGSIGALPVGLLVFVIGLSLGGTTGYAINPARDLGPRIMHALLPIKDKGSNDWNYSWVPIIGPIVGCLIAAGLYILLGL